MDIKEFLKALYSYLLTNPGEIPTMDFAQGVRVLAILQENVYDGESWVNPEFVIDPGNPWGPILLHIAERKRQLDIGYPLDTLDTGLAFLKSIELNTA